MGWGYHGNYHGAETVQSSKSYGPLQNIVQDFGRSVMYMVTFLRVHHLGRIQVLKYITGGHSAHTSPAVQKITTVCRHGLGLSWQLYGSETFQSSKSYGPLQNIVQYFVYR